jgi:DNA repair protein RadA/Sms
MEGRRALVTEIQALVSAFATTVPRRVVSGLDASRFAMILAVLQRRGKVRVHDKEVFAATVGGIRVVEPAADLAVGLAVASVFHEVALAPDMVAIGEVGLTGEIRRVAAVPKRLAEAARLGFRFALVPPGCGPAASRPGTGRHAGARGGRHALRAAGLGAGRGRRYRRLVMSTLSGA